MLMCNPQKEAETLFYYYERIRNGFHGGARNCMINVGPPLVEYNGTLIPSGFLAAYVSEDNNSNSGRAQSLSMETKMIKGKYEHRLVIRKKFSKSQKRDILQIVANRIQQLYPNDYISYDNSVPFLISLTDMRDFISSMQQ